MGHGLKTTMYILYNTHFFPCFQIPGDLPSSEPRGGGPPSQVRDSSPGSGPRGGGTPPSQVRDSSPGSGPRGGGTPPSQVRDSSPGSGPRGGGMPPSQVNDSSPGSGGRNFPSLKSLIFQNFPTKVLCVCVCAPTCAYTVYVHLN